MRSPRCSQPSAELLLASRVPDKEVAGRNELVEVHSTILRRVVFRDAGYLAEKGISKLISEMKTAWNTAKEWMKRTFTRSRKEESHPGFSYRDQTEEPFCAGRRESEETSKALESKIHEAFQDLNNKMKALQEIFKNLESKQSEEIRAELEKNSGYEEEEIVSTLKAKLNMKLRELSRKIQCVEEDVEEWPEAIKDDLQLFRAELKKSPGYEEEEIARALESKLKKNFRELSRRIRTLQRDVEEWPEAIMDELQLFRAELKKNSGYNAEEIAMAVLMNLLQLSQGSIIVEDLKKAINHEVLFPIEYLEKNSGNSTTRQHEEIECE
ncbi:uncharacterized protein LOC119696420 isoform X2 [Motacilla alba alba]|uniref:uncharacterized protein LOC119696420 isoform X2 n=1 Tax=Motacilla alba alba TaxID=1094192 RepID=UPI0018D4DB9A|nr:uncharacterized protein LOC119696420 isoform X2 [Motacilla alba alba]